MIATNVIGLLAKLNAGLQRAKKEHMRDAKNNDNNATAISRHAVELGHSIDWENCEILQIETDYHKR